MRAALDRLACRIGAHRWTKPFSIQCPTVRVVSRYCSRCDATRHTEQDVWDEPTREFTLLAFKAASGTVVAHGGDVA